MAALPFLRWLRRSPSLHLVQLPDDVLAKVFFHLMQPIPIGAHFRIVEASYGNALSLSQTCTRLYHVFHQCLNDCELWQSGGITDRAVVAIARNANSALRRMVLRRCFKVGVPTLNALAQYCCNLRTLDLSFVNVGDADLRVVLGGRLKSLLLRGCVRLTDATLKVIGKQCTKLEALDMCALPLVTDAGVEELARGVGERLTMVVFSECCGLTDSSLESFGRWCTKLEVVTCRSLPLISNAGVDLLCKGAGERLSILDILDCDQIVVKPFLASARRYCPQLAKRFDSAEGRSLKQVVISSLSGFIFHVTGSDIHNGKAAVYFLLVDSGTSNSFRVSIGSSSLDLTNYGSILASCFGDQPNEQVKQTLLQLYGLDLDAEEQEIDE